MQELDPANERCLTSEERRELQEQWKALQAALEPVGTHLGGAEDVDCEELYTVFLRLEDTFEAFEHSLMRSKQIRMLRAAQGD